ncbi:hypothetical protein EPO05_04170 [Patescibacteria group bacterium]|nr:MAG: hypothetical protein EPO05_04170 [Patescibacteria group bacterium]
MFKILKFVIWIVGIVGVAYLILRYRGYDVNWMYFDSHRAACREMMKRCQEDFMAKGYENPECKLRNCVFDTVDNSDQIIFKLK